jgi:hypothetical protein
MNDPSINSHRPWRKRGATAFAVSAVALAVALLGSGCSIIRQPYSEVDDTDVRIAGMPHVRAWADDPSQSLLGLNTSNAPPTMLTLSGGGAEGAYGAGFLSGWSDAGTRPRFSIVTGTSVGALMAPPTSSLAPQIPAKTPPPPAQATTRTRDRHRGAGDDARAGDGGSARAGDRAGAGPAGRRRSRLRPLRLAQTRRVPHRLRTGPARACPDGTQRAGTIGPSGLR